MGVQMQQVIARRGWVLGAYLCPFIEALVAVCPVPLACWTIARVPINNKDFSDPRPL